MNFTESVTGGQLTLSLQGQLDESTYMDAEKKLNETLSNDMDEVVLDMENLDYISSLGIRVLISAYKKSVKMDKKLTIGNMSDKSREILDMVGVLPIFGKGKNVV